MIPHVILFDKMVFAELQYEPKIIPVSSSGPFSNRPRTIFQRAIEASKLKWDDKHLKRIIKADIHTNSGLLDMDMVDYQGQPMWNGEII